MSQPILIPLINTNEPEALLASLDVNEGQYIETGQVLCTLETTKSTVDLSTELPGFVVGLRFGAGQTVYAGETLCYIADSPEWQPEENIVTSADVPMDASLPGGLRITQPALELAQKENLDMDQLPVGPLITRTMVEGLLKKRLGMENGATEGDYDPSAIIVYGGGGHGKSVIDLLRALKVYRILGVLDDGIPEGEDIMGVSVLGGGEVLPELHDQGIRQAVNAVGGIGNVHIRMEVFRKLASAGFVCPAVVHPTALVEPSALLSPGVQVFPLAYVGSEARVGFGSIVNTGAVVSHECTLGAFSNISPGALLAGGVQVGERALVGMGVTVNLQVNIGAGARIGNGATIKEHVPDGGVVRAGTIWPE